jgi:hypothetical protein
MTIQEMLEAMNPESKLEVLTIVDGRFSEAGNYLGIANENYNGHVPLHIYKAQMASLGWSKDLDNVELPFAGLGHWHEVPNKPGSMRYTATIIYRTMQELVETIQESYNLNKQISNIYLNSGQL